MSLRKVVLLIEDDDDLAFLAEEVISKEFKVVRVRSAEAAVAMLKSYPVDLALVDYNLWNKNGSWFIKTVRELGFTIPLIGNSGEEGSNVEMIKMGANYYINKPCSSKDLLSKINYHIEKEVV